MSQSVSLSTVQNWEKDVDSLREWLRYDQYNDLLTLYMYIKLINIHCIGVINVVKKKRRIIMTYLVTFP